MSFIEMIKPVITDKMKKILITIFLLIPCIALHSQDAKDYFSILGGGGVHNLKYSFQESSNHFQGSAGYLLNVNYSHFLNSNWGISTGIGASTYSGHSILNFTSRNMETDFENDSYEFRAKFQNWEEKQYGLFWEIPLTLQFRQRLSNKDHLLLGLGGKISSPFKTTYKVTGGEITTTGYYSQWNVEFSNLPQYGLTTISNRPKGDLTMKTSYALTADLGTLHQLNNHIGIYLGGYFNYGLNNILLKENKLIYESKGNYNGVLSSSQVSDVKQFAYGVKVGVYFALGKKKKNSDQILSEQPQRKAKNISNQNNNLTQASNQAIDSIEKESISEDNKPLKTKGKNDRNKDNTPSLIQEKIKIVSDQQSNSGTDSIQLKRYSVVIGSFIYKTNALKLKSKMENEGYKIVLALNEQQMFRVIIATFDKVEDAIKECRRIRNKYTPQFYDIWILKKINN